MLVFNVSPNGQVSQLDLGGLTKDQQLKAIAAMSGSLKDLPNVADDVPEGGYEPKVELPIKELVVLDKENQRVKSSITGIPKWLTPEEVAVYDYMNGVHRFKGEKGKDFQKCVQWFKDNNPDAFVKVIQELV